MKISPKYKSEDWKSLNLTKRYSSYWKTGANIVQDRINGRYLVQIDILEKHLKREIWEFSGFLIMAIDCMVIETLNQFNLGIEDTNRIYRNRNWESFSDFFKRSNFFKDHFDDIKAHIFYDHIRNGLLHQSQTKRKSLINIKEKEMVKKVNSDDINEGMIINRRLFHKALLNEFNSYIEKLKTDNLIYDNLREKCVTKMNLICL
jgi:hypothetical protein